MPENKILKATNSIVAILDPLESEDRARVIQAALMVLGDQDLSMTPPQGAGVQGRTGNGGDSTSDAKAYFDLKEPKTKGEELATAARFREVNEDAEVSTMEELKAVIRAARRNFDANNFHRDLENARTKGLFNRRTGKNAAVLSHYGQNYVDALPDREAVKKLRKPKGAGRKKKATKKKAMKKKASRA